MLPESAPTRKAGLMPIPIVTLPKEQAIAGWLAESNDPTALTARFQMQTPFGTVMPLPRPPTVDECLMFYRGAAPSARHAMQQAFLTESLSGRYV